MEGWIWAALLPFSAQGRAAEQQNLLLMLSPPYPRTPQPVLPSQKSSPASAQAAFVRGDPILELQVESGFHSQQQQQHIVPQFPLPQKQLIPFLEVL